MSGTSDRHTSRWRGTRCKWAPPPRPEVRDRGQRRPVTGVELVLEVDDLDEEHARVTAAGWPLAEDLTDRPWGLRDFRLLDPSGYYWRVTSRAPRPQ